MLYSVRIIALFFSLLFISTGNSESLQQPALSVDINKPVIKLAIRPKAEPSPSLKYTLYPELRNQVFGNAAQGYYRAFSPDWVSYRNEKDYAKKQDKWLSIPIKDLDEKEINIPKGMLAQLHESSLKTHCDWDMLGKLKQDGIQMLLPDLQVMREFSRALAIDCRVQLKKGDIDKALEDIKTGLTLSRHIGDGPTLIQGLVAVAAGSMMFPRIEELIQFKQAPNLYWALTTLPSPLIDFHKAFNGEVIMVDSFFPGLRDMLYSQKITPLTDVALSKILSSFTSVLNAEVNTEVSKNPLKDALIKAGLIVNLGTAKKLLIDFGISESSLEKIPAIQIVFLAEVLLYDQVYQDLIKWRYVSYSATRQKVKEAEAKITKPKSSVLSPVPLGVFSSMLLPAVSRVMEAGPKMERKIAALRIIEAIRLQTAFDKAWPDSLEKITLVPVPTDPFTGKAFAYKKEGKKITITAMVPEGETPSPNNNFTYVLELED